MGNGKVVYGKELVLMVIHVYGKNSQIYLAMMRGEVVSGMVKDSIKHKGTNYRIKDKKNIYKLCKQVEEKLLASEDSVGV